jgi:ring-1,2-phenylacetyl-CoA epoxidase subunit PaaE
VAGSGITPIVAMAEHAMRFHAGVRFTLVFGNRDVDSIIFRQRLEDLKDSHVDRFTAIHVLSRNEESDTPLLEGRITSEKVNAFAGHLFDVSDIDHVFLCGPGTMIRDVRNALFALGLPRERVHHEFFAPMARTQTRPDTSETERLGAPIASPVHQTSAAAGHSTDITAIVDGTRHRFTTRPGETVVDAALRAGVRAPYACKGGMCSTCRARVVEGRVSMRANYSLEPWEVEKGFVLTCQALPETKRLVVDYDQM